MARSRRFSLIVALLFAIFAAWLWWVKPRNVDMATYAPADSLLYLEADRPSEVVETIAGTEAWKLVENIVGSSRGTFETHWLRPFIRWTGIGPIQSVILARAQVAVVVTDLRIEEEGETLNVKPEWALLIETHTSEWRIRPSFETALKTLAERTYEHPTLRSVTVDGFQYSEWIAPENSRRIVGAIAGSLAIIGTSERVLQNCLAAARGNGPRLKGDPELHAMRLQLQRERALTFGYVPSQNSARLLAIGLPVLLGRAPGDSESQRLITTGATKVFGSLGWASSPYLSGIEDRYVITLQPSIVARLKPTFGSTNINSQMQEVVPSDVYSVTCYKFASPAAAWQSLKTAVSSQVDALSTILFSSLLKSSLLSYGIDDAETFLGAVDGELITLRLDEDAERSILIARVHDRATLRQLVTKKMSLDPRNSGMNRTEMFENSQEELAVGLGDEFIVMGYAPDVRRYDETKGAGRAVASPDNLKRMTFFLSSRPAANVVTYTNDLDRVRSFISTIIAAKGGRPVGAEDIEQRIATLPYSVTETTLGERGIERITRSPLGQFSTLLPLLFP
jgi:hypothetical protein